MVEKTKVLFLDDMDTRHKTFMELFGSREDLDIYQVWDAHSAIQLLGDGAGSLRFDQVFLDHDLSEEDIMVDVGAMTKFPTGMAVVDHILKMQSPPRQVVVHTCNTPAAVEMTKRLMTVEGMHVRRSLFPEFIAFALADKR